MKDVLKQSMGNIFGKRNKFSDLQMVLFYGLLELYLGVSGNAPGVANFAHLGGMLFGFLLIQRWRMKKRR